MPLILQGNVATATASTGYNVANSCRFDGADSLQRSKGTQSSLQKGTYSFWIKRTNIDGTQHFVYSNSVDASNKGYYSLRADEKFRIVSDASSGELVLETSQLLRDPTAWMHIVIRIDTTQSTAANRCIFYINGVAVTALDTTTYPDQNANLKIFEGGETDKEFIGGMTGETSNLHCYLAEFVFCDGQSLAPTSFGEFNEDSPTIWQPIDVSGLTFGNQGFYLDFEDSSALGNSSNSNNFGTVNNLTAIDQCVDTCTNNFCTFNPLIKQDHAFSEGNLKYTSSASDWDCGIATIPFSSGKWYMEQKITAVVGGIVRTGIGICDVRDQNLIAENEFGYKPSGAVGDSIGYNDNAVHKNDSAQSGSWGDMDNGDVALMAVDLDNSAVYFGLNGTWGNSGDPTSGASKTGAIGFTAGQTYVSGAIGYGGGAVEQNWGNPVSALSSGNADANGYGDFEYAPPSGYYALCTKNLGEFGG